MAVERIKKDIIENTNVTMQKILNSEIPHAKQLDISTGYFDVAGYGMLRSTLDVAARDESFCMRLLLGKEAILSQAGSFEKYAKQYNESIEGKSVKTSLDDSELLPESRDDTAGLIKLLEQENIHIRLGPNRFNHSKCYILGNNSVFIGSSNLTAGGMTGNYELNAGLYQPGIAEQTRAWFDRMWENTQDTKQQLIDVLKQSKFGVPPEPYQIYMKMLFERFRPLLENVDHNAKESKILTKFQQDAVHVGQFIVSEYGGVIIADATGLGKTNMGIELIRQKVLKEGKRVLLVAPSQVLHSMWKEKLKEVDINVREMLTMESLGRDTIIDTLDKYRNIDLVLIDESQNFRSKSANRRNNLMKLMSIGKRKQAILLTATPINNSLMDLYYQLSIITGGDDSYFYRTIGIQDLYKHMRDAANKDLTQGLEKIQQLLDFVMVRRTRSYIKDVYKDDKIGGKAIKFPTHQYTPIEYSLSDLFGNIFQKILDDISKLTMAPYGMGRYDRNMTPEERDKEKRIAHLQITLLLKRFESSIEAIRISLENKVNLYKYIKKVLDEGKILQVRDFNKIITKWSSAESSENPDTDIDEDEKMEFFLKEIKEIQKENIGNYDVELLKKDMQKDLEILENLLEEVKKITVDTKIDKVIETILLERVLENESKKVLIFTEYTATARYITKKLREKFPKNIIECITGNTKPDTRISYIRRFAPVANLLEDETLDTEEIDILVSTEVLAEGQNLQDCNYVINYDLPWNPMRIVQRTGRVDRLTSTYDVIHTRACYPDKDLDNILKLMGKLLDKIHVVDDVIGGDSEILGETPTPKQFNGTIQRIKVLADKDGANTLIQKMERESDIMPALSPINVLGRYINEKGIDFMKDISMGCRSGKKGESQEAVLAYLQEKPERKVHFVHYDFKTNKVLVPDDDSKAINLVSCMYDTPKHLPMDDADNQESFELLLGIDQKSRKAIKEKNDTVSSYLKNLNGEKYKKHDKNVNAISKIILDAILQGKIIKEDGKNIINIAKSEYIRHWANDLNLILLEYEQSQEIANLITRIKKMSQWIGIQEKTEPIKAKEEEQRIEQNLKLIGAMFITPEKFDESQSKERLDKF